MNYRDEEYCKVGDVIPEPRPSIYKLDIDAHVNRVGHICPHDYFITSGDAVAKAAALATDLEDLANTDGEFAQLAADAAVAARNLVRSLIAVRGDSIFLELEWTPDHTLLCIPKNPRNRFLP